MWAKMPITGEIGAREDDKMLKEELPQSGLLSQTLRHESLSDQIYARLRRAIMSGQLSPGERLVYRTLASEMGVSPTPVRDAVHRLVSDGVLEMGDRGTASLPRLDPDRFVEIITLRIELEGRAAAAAATHGGPEVAAELAELNAGMEAARACGDRHTTLDLNEKLHFSIIRRAEMPVMEGLLHSLWLQCGPSLQFLYTEDYPKSTFRHPHYDLIEAVDRRDAPAARAAITQDLVRHGCHILRKIRENIGEVDSGEIPTAWLQDSH